MKEEQVREIEVHQISFNPNQPRMQFERDALEELASSIKAVGLIHPPVVRLLTDPHAENPRYELISGERRLKALVMSGHTKIPAIVKESTTCLSAQAALIENIQRVDLNPLEIANALKKLVLDFGFTQDFLAQRVAKSRSNIANHLRLLSLPEAIQQSLLQNKISMGHAKAILSLDTEEEQTALHHLILKKNLSVRGAEALVKKKSPLTPQKKPPNPHLDDLKRRLEEHLGTSCTLTGNKLTIDYYSLDDLTRLLQLIGLESQ